MSNVFTLDALREEVEKEFAPVKIQLGDGSEVVLRNLLRLKKTERETVMDLLDALDTDEDKVTKQNVNSVTETVSDVLGIVADRPDALLAALGDDLQLLLRVLETWMEASQPGEASNSPS